MAENGQLTASFTIGAEMPTFARTTSLANWNRFAAVNDEFVPIHMDDESGREAGYDGAFGMGNLLWSYVHNALREWVGESGRIERVEMQFRSPNLRGQTVTVDGRVQAVRTEGHRTVIDIQLQVAAQDGTILAPGNATVSR